MYVQLVYVCERETQRAGVYSQRALCSKEGGYSALWRGAEGGGKKDPTLRGDIYRNIGLRRGHKHGGGGDRVIRGCKSRKVEEAPPAWRGDDTRALVTVEGDGRGGVRASRKKQEGDGLRRENKRASERMARERGGISAKGENGADGGGVVRWWGGIGSESGGKRDSARECERDRTAEREREREVEEGRQAVSAAREIPRHL